MTKLLNHLILVALSLCFLNTANAQQDSLQVKIDSLLKVIRNAKSDTAKAAASASLGMLYENSSPATGIVWAKKALAFYGKAVFPEGQARSYNLLGVLYDREGDYQNALNAHIQSKVLYETLKDQLGVALNDANMANIYAHYGNDFKKSLDEELRLFALMEKMGGQDTIIVGLLLDMGDGYEHLNQTDKALKAVRKAQQVARKINFYDNNGVAFNNLGNIYLNMYVRSAASLMYRDSAAANYRKALAFYNTGEGDPEGISEVSLGLAHLYNTLNIQDSCLYYADLSFKTAQKGKFRPRILEAAKLLAIIYKQRLDLRKAITFMELGDSLSTTLYHQDKVRSIALLFEGERKRSEAVREEIERQRKADRDSIQLILISFFILVFGLIVFFYSRKKANPKVIRTLVFFGLLMIFEFINLLLHPYIGHITRAMDDVPLMTLLVLMAEAAVLSPAHERAEEWVKRKLVH